MRSPARLALAALAIVTSTTALAAASRSYGDDIKPFEDELRAECPERKLNLLSPSDLDMIIEEYRDGLSAVQHAKLERASRPMCVGIQGGLSCQNIAYIRGITKLGLMHRFALSACHSGYACKGQSDCEQLLGR